jgi:hypothetical protein
MKVLLECVNFIVKYRIRAKKFVEATVGLRKGHALSVKFLIKVQTNFQNFGIQSVAHCEQRIPGIFFSNLRTHGWYPVC